MTRPSDARDRSVSGDDDPAVRRIAHALAQADEPAELFQDVADTARAMSGAAAAYIERLSASDETVVIVASSGHGVPPIGTRVPFPGSLTE